MKAVLKNYGQSPRKVRLIADAVRGKEVARALTLLEVMDKRASLPVQKLIASAVANAKEKEELRPEQLVVKEIRVDKGIVMKRFMPRARGSASPINRRTSHITLLLAKK